MKSNVNRLTHEVREHNDRRITRRQAKQLAGQMARNHLAWYHSVKEDGYYEIIGTKCLWHQDHP